MPAGPNTVSNEHRRSDDTMSHMPRSAASSSPRPTIGTSEKTRSPAATSGAIAIQAGTGSTLPFAVIGSVSRYSITVRVEEYVSCPTRTESTGALDCSRAAVLTTSPATIATPVSGRAPSSTIASPVLTAARICSSSSGSASSMSAIESRTAIAARTARSASSPYATGAPKTAITASPMNFSTVPPNRSISARARS